MKLSSEHNFLMRSYVLDLPMEQRQPNDLSMSPGVLRFVAKALLQNNTYTAASLHDHIDLDFPLMMRRSESPPHPGCPPPSYLPPQDNVLGLSLLLTAAQHRLLNWFNVSFNTLPFSKL